MDIYLGLGSNEGQRRVNLGRAIDALNEGGVAVKRVSPVVESPAMLPPKAPSDWNRPYLNLVVRASTSLEAQSVLELAKRIESELGRVPAERWSPRPVDIDLLLYGRQEIHTETLCVPHAGITERSFVLSPLVAIDPGLTIPGRGQETVLEHSIALNHHIPLWMGIVNITPDSFSDGGLWTRWEDVEPRVENFFAAGTQIVDLGAESTRPGAARLTADQEWERLAPVLEPLIASYSGRWIRPLVSVDTYHAETARRALECGIDILNDVSGLTNPEMIDLAVQFGVDCVAMHELTLPASPDTTLAADCEPLAVIERWIGERQEDWGRRGLDSSRVYLDPGIGFGKTPLQSLELLRLAGQLRRLGLRTLIGHSRKSFMGSFTRLASEHRDLTTIGASMQLVSQGVDVLRVHDPVAHLMAYQGWSHVAGNRI